MQWRQVQFSHLCMTLPRRLQGSNCWSTAARPGVWSSNIRSADRPCNDSVRVCVFCSKVVCLRLKGNCVYHCKQLHRCTPGSRDGVACPAAVWSYSWWRHQHHHQIFIVSCQTAAKYNDRMRSKPVKVRLVHIFESHSVYEVSSVCVDAVT